MRTVGDGLRCSGLHRNRLRAEGLEAPHWSDFWLYGAAPTGVHTVLVAAAVAIWAQVAWAAEALAGVLLALLLLGMRNAWDLITWMAPGQGQTTPARPEPSSGDRLGA